MVNCVLLNGSEIWVDTTKIAKYRQKISFGQRQVALRFASAYHAVSLVATQVVASVIPTNLLELEWKYVYESAGMDRETQWGGGLLPHPVFNRSRVLP